MVSFTHEQNSICSQKQLNDIAHEHTIICRQLFAGHVVGSRPMKRKKHLYRMIKPIVVVVVVLYVRIGEIIVSNTLQAIDAFSLLRFVCRLK